MNLSEIAVQPGNNCAIVHIANDVIEVPVDFPSGLPEANPTAESYEILRQHLSDSQIGELLWQCEQVVIGPSLEPCEWQGRLVYITEGCWQDGALLCGVFANEDDARSDDPDSAALAIINHCDLTATQQQVAARNSARL